MTSSTDLMTNNKMKKTYRLLTYITLPASLAAFGLSLFMAHLATPPVDEQALIQWLVSHQEQFLFAKAGWFYWTDIHSAMLFGGIAFLLPLAMVIFSQLLIFGKVAKGATNAVVKSGENTSKA